MDEVVSALTGASNREPTSPGRAVHLVVDLVHHMTVRDARQTCAAAGGRGSPPRVIMRIRRYADVSMTLEIYSNASPMATREAQRTLGEPLQVLLIALSFRDDLREHWSG